MEGDGALPRDGRRGAQRGPRLSGEASDKGRVNMGKFLETLKQATPRRVREEEKVRPAAPPDAAAAEDAPSDEEIPFIEVGPHKSMDASASVLAVRPAPAAVALRPAPAADGPRMPPFAPEIVAHHQPDHPVSGQYRELLAAMTPAPPARGRRPCCWPRPCRERTPLSCSSTSPSPPPARATVASSWWTPTRASRLWRNGLACRRGPAYPTCWPAPSRWNRPCSRPGRPTSRCSRPARGAGGAAAGGRDAGLGVASASAALRSGAGTWACVGRAARSDDGRGL